MTTKVHYLLIVGCSLAAVAWIVHASNPPGQLLNPALAVEREPEPLQTDKGQTNDVPEKYRETVRKGLEYLVKNQCQDGHWEGDGGKHPVAMTGLTGLALLMERDVWNDYGRRVPSRKGNYTDSIVKAVDWLLEQSQAGRDGLIFSGHPSETTRYMEGHGLATLFLAGVCRDEWDDGRRKKLTDALTRAVKYIVKAQSNRGGWYHTSMMEGHDFDAIVPSVIQIQALQAAEYAWVPMPHAIMRDAHAYLKQELGDNREEPKTGQGPNRPVKTAAALACCTSDRFGGYSGLTRTDKREDIRKTWMSYCQNTIPMGQDMRFGRDELAHYYYAQGALNLVEVDAGVWSRYRSAMFDHLQSSQHKDGSWPPGDGLGVGPVYSTAVWCTVLQLDKKSHPSTRTNAAIE